MFTIRLVVTVYCLFYVFLYGLCTTFSYLKCDFALSVLAATETPDEGATLSDADSFSSFSCKFSACIVTFVKLL